MIWRCDLSTQYKKYKKEIDSSIFRVLKSGIYTLGPELVKFEIEFAEYINVRYAVGVANGTDALILAMKALNIGAGDEVITSPYTAIPTVSAIIAVEAKPVFADIDQDTFLIDLNKVGALITQKTKAIIPVHIFGNVVDIQKLRKIVGSKIKIIEDACQAHGSSFDGKKAGSMGNISAFSFYPTKNVGGYGDGGMITTNDKSLADKIKLLRMYGMINKDYTVLDGVNSRLDELQAAILRVKLKFLDSMNKARDKIAFEYISQLPKNLFKHQLIPSNVFSNYHVFVSRFLENRDDFIKYMDKNKIQTNVYYRLPLHLQKSLNRFDYEKGDLPVAEELCKQAVALPFYPELEKTTLKKIITHINKF